MPDAELDEIPLSTRSDLGSTTEMVQDTGEVIAKAHHGSVSKEKRLLVEHELKTGHLPCVVATSSLELGIDMGSIDLVLQVAAPPSVSSGLQRIGRANHQVGGRSAGSIYPRTRTEIIDATVVAEGMNAGMIEKTSLVRNPLDVLAQQTVAAVAMDEMAADAWYETVRRAAPFSHLPRRAFDSVLGMLAGRHTSGDLTEFRPRIVWDLEHGTLPPRPGAQRQAVTSAGTIPDRGMFSVVLPEGDNTVGRRRVGELDEEMVYESRVGDIIALGTSTWRIREITRDRVIVEPAPGRSARLPFWHGEGMSRPAETGKMRGSFLRAVAAGIDASNDSETRAGLPYITADARARLDSDGLDADAQNNLVELIRAQREATGVIPNDEVLVVERCEDETGDWRVLLHSPYGRRVHEPWAMALSDRIGRLYGYDPQAVASDNGIALRIPLTESRVPGAELFVFDPDELDRIVRGRVDATALFAARFRECAARALLMSPPAPGKRAALWQQRLKAGQLLEVARRERDFPILVETARECLQDVYDMPALHELMEGVQQGTICLAEAQTTTPSPFAAPLLFGYVGDNLYSGDLPHAERRASLLALDPMLLGELLGSADMSQLLDENVIRSVEERLQHTAPDRLLRGSEGAADLLRTLGPLSVEEVACRLVSENNDGAETFNCHATMSEARSALEVLQGAHRAFLIAADGVERWASVDDAVRLHDALGIKVPTWISATHVQSEEADDAVRRHPLDGLVARYARTHGPFSTEAVAVRLGIGPAIVHESLERLIDEGRIMRGHFGDDGANFECAWVSSAVFKRLRSLSLAQARKAVRAVDTEVFVRFLFDLQGVGSVSEERFEGIEGVAHVISQFEGVFLPAAAWESSVLPARVRNFRPAMIDELLASGDVVWVGSRRERDDDAVLDRGKGHRASADDAPVGLVAFYPTDSPLAPVELNHVAGVSEPTLQPNAAESAVVAALSLGGGLFFRQIVDAVRQQPTFVAIDEAALAAALLDLMWSGQATNDTFAPVRVLGSGSKTRPVPRRRVSSRRSRTRSAINNLPARAAASTSSLTNAVLAGRWSLIAPSSENDTVCALALVESIIDRYGVLTRDIAMLSGVPGGMPAIIPVLRSMEDAGDVLRGAFVQGLGPAQFAARETVDVLRTYGADQEIVLPGKTIVIATDDPACLFGAGIPWPENTCSEAVAEMQRLTRPARRPGSLVVVHDGRPVLYATAGLHALLSFTTDVEVLSAAVSALVAQVARALSRAGAGSSRKKLVVASFNNQDVLTTAFADILQAAGFVRLPDGMRLYVTPF